MTFTAFSAVDRLGLMGFAAGLIHVVLILGLSFSMPPPRPDTVDNLDVTLVQSHSERAPDDPQFLAQANQDGGGTTDRADVASSPLPLNELSDKNDRLPVLKPPPREQVVSLREVPPLMARAHAPKKIRLSKIAPEAQEPEFEPENLGLIEEEIDTERARLSAEIARNWQEYQKRPKRKFLNARTKEYKYALYIDAWRAKVERVGNLNYPEEARRRSIAGNLMLDVAINSDGTLERVTIRRSSGKKLLDDAAIRIVELAAPFPPFSADILAEANILHITRTWKFNENTLATEASPGTP